MSIETFRAPDGLGLPELVELGRRLDDAQLDSLELTEHVMNAERESFWRVSAAVQLLKGTVSYPIEQLDSYAGYLETQLTDPIRGTADRPGLNAHPRGRRLPEAGTVIVKRHKYQALNAPRIKRSEGGVMSQHHWWFKFLVIEPRGELLLFGDKNDVIYGNPSSAAAAATGNQGEQGWHFFGVPLANRR